MKKNISYVKTAESQAFHTNSFLSSRKPFHIYEKPSTYGSFSQEDCRSYKQSFMKQRMLMIWKNQRSLLKAAPMFPEPLESMIYTNIYQRIKPLLIGAYHEDFHRSDSEFTLESWLNSLQETAHQLKRTTDILYWQEIIEFVQSYADHSQSEDTYIP